MKHTRITITETAIRYLAASENNLTEVIAGMTLEIHDADEQCKAITGMSFTDLCIKIQDGEIL